MRPPQEGKHGRRSQAPVPALRRQAALAGAAVATAALLPALALAAGTPAGARAHAERAQSLENPCLGPAASGLRCPDLVMRPPSQLTLDRRTRPGRLLLRAANSIDNVGTGPVELRGRRDGRATMSVRQRIYRTSGGRLSVPARARLSFYPIPGQYRYWKVRQAARFELWSLDAGGERAHLVRTGPKLHYCFRDLERRNPSRRSPRSPVYPACDQSARTRAVTLGTSVGWSDVYPASYHEQWIDVTGLRGRFAYAHTADPGNGIFESREDNNRSQTLVTLPPRPGGGGARDQYLVGGT